MRLLTALIIILIFILPLNAQQNIEVYLKEKLVIGADENAPEEYCFNYPKNLIIDSQGNIWVQDMRWNKVRVFDKHGKFIKYIGEIGQGPGELQECLSTTLDNNDNLIVTDRKNMRITRFSQMGGKYKCYRLPNNIEPMRILYLSKNEVIFYYHKTKLAIPQKTDKLLHVYSNDFQYKKSFGSAGDIYDFNEPFIIEYLSLDSWATLNNVDSAKVLFVPGFYDGIVYMYEKIKGAWVLKKLHGKNFFKKPYKLINPNKFNPRHHVPFTNFISGAMGKFYYKELCRNIGIVSVDDSTIAHFSFRVNRKNKYVLNIELFKLTGEFIGYATGADIKVSPNKQNFIIGSIYCNDENYNIYVSECLPGGIVAIKKFTFRYQFK